MNTLLATLLGQVFSPVISFLKQQGVWDALVAFWAAVSGFITVGYAWLSTHVDMAMVWRWAITFFKFVFAVLITLFQILTNLFTWLTHYFK